MDKFIKEAKKVFKIESSAITNLGRQLNNDFSEIVKKILKCKGRVIVCGMGKSGIIGRKISATFASTGTPSFFMHPAEAFHGDLGILKKYDILLLISYSGNNEEILKIVPFLKENGNLIISMTGNPNSTLANYSDYHLDISIKREACPLRLAPTSSTTTTLVMGDALAVVLMKERKFKAEDFARFHPGGDLGRKLLTKVGDVMIKNNLPVVNEDSSMKDVIRIMTSARLGTAVALDAKQRIIGIITDGDLRRALEQHENVLSLKVKDIMTKNPKAISKDAKLVDAEKMLAKYEILTLLIADEKGRMLGILPVHEIQNPERIR
jgi:arabinose-5-phosphate isomerase